MEEPEIDIETSGFASLGLIDELVKSLNELGYEEPTPIQSESIKHLLDGRDLLGQAATGTGKTAAFALPMLQRLATMSDGSDRVAPAGLILVPTRELAMQVSEAVHRYGRHLGTRVLPVFGGQPIARQLHALRRGVDVVVATPGRAIDHINRGTLVLDDITMVVLDEADEMFDMGFAEDIETILEGVPSTRQTVLFSATMPSRINGVARRHLDNPVKIEIERKTSDESGAPLVQQRAYIVPRAHKPAALVRILDIESPAATLVFCRTRIEVDELTQTLNGRGYRAEALHGGMNQDQRDRVMGRLRNATAELLVATDVAARGLDVDQLTHVINYDVPSAPESYVHRIGRVGRAGREGVAITLAEPREHRMLKNIERLTKQRITFEKVPTVADLRTMRMAMTQASLRETIMEGELDRFRAIVEALSDEFDVMEVALAAVKIAHESDGAEADQDDIPEFDPREDRDRKPNNKSKPKGKSTSSDWRDNTSEAGTPRKARSSDKKSFGDRDDRGSRGNGERGRDDRGGDRGRGNDRGDRGRDDRGGERRPRPSSEGMVRLFVGAGRLAGVRPKDLVGAIANESGLSGRDIGAIEIADRFSLVEIPEASANDVVAALKKTRIKGDRATVRLERDRP